MDETLHISVFLWALSPLYYSIRNLHNHWNCSPYRTRMLSQSSVHQTTVIAVVTWRRFLRSGKIWTRTSSNLTQRLGKLSQTQLARPQTTFCNCGGDLICKLMLLSSAVSVSVDIICSVRSCMPDLYVSQFFCLEILLLLLFYTRC
jgi:hypothetical protein